MESPERSRKGRHDSIWQRTFLVSLGLLVAVSAFGAGMLAERDLFNPANSSASAVNGDGPDTGFDRLDEVRDLVEQEYYGRPATSAEEASFDNALETAAIQGMMSGLDGYSTYLVPSQQADVHDQLSGEYQGIGVWVDFPKGVATIVAPIPGSPAEAAGLRAGDVIEAVDGTSLTGVSEDDALALVRGPEGSTVTLTIRRTGEAASLRIPVVRGRIPLQSVLYHRLEPENVAWIAVSVFGDKTTAELDTALKQATADGVRGIVIDLRNNGGGWVQSAQEMIGRFVPASAGPALYEDERPDGSARKSEPIIEGDVKIYDLPLVVLVNGGTASAAEIVTGALRDYGRATVVGERTFGKGSVQRVHDFEDGASARITFAEWLTPKLGRIQGDGIAPDVVVALPDDQGMSASDPQIRAALDVLLRGSVPAVASPVASPVGA